MVGASLQLALGLVEIGQAKSRESKSQEVSRVSLNWGSSLPHKQAKQSHHTLRSVCGKPSKNVTSATVESNGTQSSIQ